jgi:hypothetical protein
MDMRHAVITILQYTRYGMCSCIRDYATIISRPPLCIHQDRSGMIVAHRRWKGQDLFSSFEMEAFPFSNLLSAVCCLRRDLQLYRGLAALYQWRQSFCRCRLSLLLSVQARSE